MRGREEAKEEKGGRLWKGKSEGEVKSLCIVRGKCRENMKAYDGILKRRNEGKSKGKLCSGDGEEQQVIHSRTQGNCSVFIVTPPLSSLSPQRVCVCWWVDG